MTLLLLLLKMRSRKSFRQREERQPKGAWRRLESQQHEDPVKHTMTWCTALFLV
jgi:hypothetical protein